PDLQAWIQLPLQARLGWRNNEVQAQRTRQQSSRDVTADWINVNARPYLFYLALTGRLRLDWGWLLGIGVLKPWTVAGSLGLPLGQQVNALVDKHRELGMDEKRCRHNINWGVPRLVLHRGDPDLFTLTVAEVEELRQVIREAATIPGLPEVLGDRLATIPAGWGTRAFKTGMALYHAGMVGALPKRQATRSRQPLSTVP